MENFCSIYRSLVFITSSTPFAVFKRPGLPRLPRVSTKMAADQGQFSGSFLQTNFQGYYECSACHVLAPDRENLLQHESAACKSGR